MNNPRHVALIPDGNRRWAKAKGKPAAFGHEAGARALDPILREALALHIPYVTFWGASVGNVTKRSKTEVAFLYALFAKYFLSLAKSKEIKENRVRIRVLGRWEEHFSAPAKKAIRQAIEATKTHDRFHLTFLLAYSGADEMLSAMRDIASRKIQDPKLEIDEAVIKDHLWTRELPPVDLVIRTGGEPHWSQGFMMWDVANSQLCFTETLWPAFGPKEFQAAVKKFSETERRMGK